jgi:hypothetical protein
MEGLVLLVVAGLLAALAMVLGLWGWRRLSRTASLETAQRAAAVALRTPGPQLAGGDADLGKESQRTSPSARTMLDTMGGTMPAISAEPAPNGPKAADPSQTPDEEEGPEQKDVPHEEAERSEPGFPIPPPPTAAEDATTPVAPVPDGGGADSAEPGLSLADDGGPVPETPDEGTALGTDDLALPSHAAEDQDGAAPVLAPFSTAGAPCGATPAEAGSAGASPEEDFPDDLAGADQEVAVLGAGPGTGEHGPATIPSSAEEPGPENSGHVEPESGRDLARDPTPESGAAVRRRQPTFHRDRRGKRRTVAAAGTSPEPVAATPGPAVVRPPAEAKLRLSLHPIRRTAGLSVVLTRPDGFPARVVVQAARSQAIEAYDEQRYDDLDLTWTSELLDGELRLASTDGFQWLRSARQVHIFADDPNEPELISVSAARAGIGHTLVCRSSDAEAVRRAALSAGSPEVRMLEHWKGIPEGWLVLSGYTPTHAATTPLPSGLRPLDPGEGLEISFDGGLAIRARVYAAGHPPRISIIPAPGAASVTIGGEPATLSSDGAWTAPGWDAPGQHIVDVVPGPSASYEIAADPWMSGGWDFWDAHPERFGNAREPWAQARICGALLRGPADETVFAAETQPTLVALGARSGATPLRRRDDAAVSVGLMPEPPAFLLSATGPRRTQGRVVWLGLAPIKNTSKRHDAEWVATVRSAAARRLPLEWADALGENAWRKAKERARRLRSRRPRT